MTFEEYLEWLERKLENIKPEKSQEGKKWDSFRECHKRDRVFTDNVEEAMVKLELLKQNYEYKQFYKEYVEFQDFKKNVLSGQEYLSKRDHFINYCKENFSLNLNIGGLVIPPSF